MNEDYYHYDSKEALLSSDSDDVKVQKQEYVINKEGKHYIYLYYILLRYIVLYI